jgi:hypothetical protein
MYVDIKSLCRGGDDVNEQVKKTFLALNLQSRDSSPRTITDHAS